MEINNKIIIYEPNHGGHRLKFVALTLETYIEKGYHAVIATTKEAVDSIEYKELLAKHEHTFELLIIPSRDVYDNSFKSRLIDAWHLMKVLKSVGKVRLLFLPYLDAVFYPLGLAGLVKFFNCKRYPKIHGILLRGDYAYQQATPSLRMRIKNKLSVWIIKYGPFNRVLCLDELLYSHLLLDLKNNTGRFSFCPDPVESFSSETVHGDFRSNHSISSDAKVLGTFGAIDERKGIEQLLKAFISYNPSENEILLLVGKQSEGIRKVLTHIKNTEKKAANIVAIDSFVSDSEMLSAIQACDAVAAIYPGHIGSSSIVIRAAAMNKPVIGTDFGWIGHVIKNNGLGHCCDVSSKSTLVAGIAWSFTKASMDIEKTEKFVSEHTVANFSSAILTR